MTAHRPVKAVLNASGASALVPFNQDSKGQNADDRQDVFHAHLLRMHNHNAAKGRRNG